MTHQPPVPEGSQSPFPTQEPPHAKSDGPPAGAEVARTAENKSAVRPAIIGSLVAAGVAAVAAAGAWAYATTPKYKRKERRRRKAR